MNVILFLVERKDEDIIDPDEEDYHRKMIKSNHFYTTEDGCTEWGNITLQCSYNSF